ncbi:MAG: hypothetical protein IJO39_00630 [Clostridia bacterium]|nr:hypothetical protein [Clostridia bacterium]
MNKRKIILLAALLVMVAILGVGGTLAYFTAEDEATNTFTVGNVKIDLIEPSWKEAKDVYPGQVLPKDPTVTNTGNNPCYVRIKVEGLDVFADDYEDAMIGLRYIDADDVEKEGYNTVDWTYHDGYYYYMTELGTGEKTTALFDSIVIPTALTNDQGTEHPDPYDIDVKAYAVQSQGAPADMDSVEKIAAWFETCAPESWKVIE